MAEAAGKGTGTTLLQALMRARRLTREETVERLERRAWEMHERDFALSVRQLDRWLAGTLATTPRASTCRVVEAEFGHPIQELLAPEQPQLRPPLGGARPAVSAARMLRTAEFVAWIAEHSQLEYEDAYTAVADEADRLASEAPSASAARDHHRRTVTRARIADAVADYYGTPQQYAARIGSLRVRLSLVTEPEWLGLNRALAPDDHCSWSLARVPPLQVRLGEEEARVAIAKLAGAEVAGTVMVNNPLYRLREVIASGNEMHATFALSDFASYALTADLLEDELIDWIIDGNNGPLPLRQRYLPSLDAVRSFDARICAGGPVCLTAIARDVGDYALLFQERASDVVNVAGRLAVTPKAFHQPTADAGAEVSVRATVERELEEELLGRVDLESLATQSTRRVAPSHPLARSEPMSWLYDHDGAYRSECTSFGINLVTGNYEFAGLVLVEDPRWWADYAHRVEANWEALRLRCLSSRDTDGLMELAADPRWSNEGLFGLLEGLRRLAELDPERVAIPSIEID